MCTIDIINIMGRERKIYTRHPSQTDLSYCIGIYSLVAQRTEANPVGEIALIYRKRGRKPNVASAGDVADLQGRGRDI